MVSTQSHLSSNGHLYLQLLHSANITVSAPPQIIRNQILIRNTQPRSLPWVVHSRVRAPMESGATTGLMGGGVQGAMWALGLAVNTDEASLTPAVCHGPVVVCGPGSGDPVGSADIRKTCAVTLEHFSSTESSSTDCRSAGTFHKTRPRLRDKLRSTQIRSKDFLHCVTLEPFYEDIHYLSSVETWPSPWIRIIVLAVSLTW